MDMKFSLSLVALFAIITSDHAAAKEPSVEDFNDLVDAKAWTDTLARERGLDRCAGAIALGLDKLPGFDPDKDWPFVCNDHRNDKEMLERVGEIGADLQSGKFTKEQLNVLREGRVPFGCAIDGMYYVYGVPDERRKSSTEEGVEEVFIYSMATGSNITFTFFEGRLKRVDE